MEWMEKTFPDYCSGSAYVLTPNIGENLFQTFLRLFKDNYIWIEDVYLTGQQSDLKNQIRKKELHFLLQESLQNQQIYLKQMYRIWCFMKQWIKLQTFSPLIPMAMFINLQLKDWNYGNNYLTMPKWKKYLIMSWIVRSEFPLTSNKTSWITL